MNIRCQCRVILVVATVALIPGCAHTAITGDGVKQAQVIHGSVGIIGDDNELTVLAGSRVTKVSVIGEENRVIIERGATVAKVELIGEENEVFCPQDLSVRFSAIGEDNRLRRSSAVEVDD